MDEEDVCDFDVERPDYLGRSALFFENIVRNTPEGMTHFQIGNDSFFMGYLEIDNKVLSREERAERFLARGEEEAVRCTTPDGRILNNGAYVPGFTIKVSNLYTRNMKVVESL